ncbi:High choriolytic enzyme 2 [Merluccius polli]|uniref:Metalloendopeptidase n=1 Tax=Merluccius polli TaxID=89951 RepID=A0AA47M9W5_MERPO|nr:High choriolytic enzyme 2 [Merluccius polli]
MTFCINLLVLTLESRGSFPPGANKPKAEEKDEHEVVPSVIRGNMQMALNTCVDDVSSMCFQMTLRTPLSTTDAIEAANNRLGRLRGRHIIEYGDIAQSLIKRNADPCTATGCNWSKSKRGFAYVPIKISTRYSMAERQVIIQSLVEFHSVSCIRFVWRLCQHDYLYFFPGNGCWSYVGRQGGRQLVSIQQHGCVSSRVIQHEILHALGFHHEQSRSDRDDFVQIVTENSKPVYLHNFNKVATNNVGTTYDYNSIMHYSRYAFSLKSMGFCRPSSPSLMLRVSWVFPGVSYQWDVP